MYEFIDRWEQRDRQARERRAAQKTRRPAADSAGPRATREAEPRPEITFVTSRELAATDFDPTAKPLTDADLRAIEDRCRRATPGGWMACKEHPDFPVIGSPVCYMDEDETIAVGQGGDFGPTNNPMDDAQFIAHARTDVPRLLKEVRRLRETEQQGTQVHE
jgi:hypothetical protein